MNPIITEKQNSLQLFQIVEKLVRSSQQSIDKSHSCVVNDIPEDLLVKTNFDFLSTVLGGMLGIAIVHAKDSCIRISASLKSNMVMVNLRDYNRFNSYSNPSGLQYIQSVAAKLGGTLAVAGMRQGEKTIALSFPYHQDAA
ncbi:MAG: hypothetical protein ABWZ25_03255 [Chitinophagaceae bacterium]